MINPDVGYRRVSAETWRHSVSKTDGFDLGPLVETSAQRRDVNLTREAVSYTHLDVYKRQISVRARRPEIVSSVT